MTEGAFNCLLDQARTRAFGGAIRRLVRSGDVVVDVGAGTGILSMIAAKTGAKKVYAIESDDQNIRTLETTFKVNGFKNIEILHGDATTIPLPETVNVIICEMVATALIEELQVPVMNNMLPYLKKGGRVLLQRMHNYIELVDSRERFHGFRFPVVRYEYSDFPKLRAKSLSERRLYACIDFSQITSDSNIEFTEHLAIKKTGRVNAIRISSESEFADGTRFHHSFAYSYPIILPITPISLKIGDKPRVMLSYKICGGMGNLKYGVNKT